MVENLLRQPGGSGRGGRHRRRVRRRGRLLVEGHPHADRPTQLAQNPEPA